MLFFSQLFLVLVYITARTAVAATFAPRAQCAALSNIQQAVNASKSTFVPVDPQGVVTPVFWPPDNVVWTYLYYQDQEGNILELPVVGTSFANGLSGAPSVVVKSNLPLAGTPIAVSAFGVPGNSTWHLYYVTPSCTLAETRWTLSTGWVGGTACSQCIDKARLVVVSSSRVLYATQDPNDVNLLRVGFESAGSPGTISEAVTTNGGTSWQLALLPDQA